MSITAMKQALGALENAEAEGNCEYGATALLRTAIEQTEKQKPAAWQVMVEDEAMKEFPIKDMAHDWCVKQKLLGSPYSYWIRPLYTTPPAAQRQSLTDEQIRDLWSWSATTEAERTANTQQHAFARAIEAAHGIGEKK